VAYLLSRFITGFFRPAGFDIDCCLREMLEESNSSAAGNGRFSFWPKLAAGTGAEGGIVSLTGEAKTLPIANEATELST
jgi:hypothetical protein